MMMVLTMMVTKVVVVVVMVMVMMVMLAMMMRGVSTLAGCARMLCRGGGARTSTL